MWSQCAWVINSDSLIGCASNSLCNAPPNGRIPEPGTPREPRVPQNVIPAGDAETLAMEEKRGFCHAFLKKPSVIRPYCPLQVDRIRLRDALLGRDLRLEQDLSAFSSGVDFDRLPALCHQRARVFHHFIDHLVVMIRIVMEKQELAHVCIKRQRNDAAQ